MARSGNKSRPGRSLIGLFVVLALIFGWVAVGAITGDAKDTSKAQWTPKLGIDLEGGTELILKPQGTSNGARPTSAQIAEAVNIIRQRVNGSGISEAQVSTQGADQIIVRLPGKTPDQKTIDLVKQSAEMSFRPVLQSASSVAQAQAQAQSQAAAGASGTATGAADPNAAAQPTAAAPAAGSSRVAPAVFMHRTAATPAPTAPAAKATPAASATPAPSGSATPAPAPTATGPTKEQIAQVCTEAAAAPEKVDEATETSALAKKTPSDLALLGKKTPSVFCPKPVAISTQIQLATCSKDQLTAMNAFVADPALPLVTCEQDGQDALVLGPVEVRGSEIKSATAGFGTTSTGVSNSQWEVQLNFKGAGTSQFSKVTQRLFKLTGDQNRFAIVLDGLVVSAPTVQGVIPTGQAQISGNFTQATASTLASQLKFGALPVSFVVSSDERLSALLGSTQLQHGLLAGLIGLVLVVLYSLAQYRALGLVTVFSLVLAGSMTYGLVLLLSWQNGYRLSLAGVAGLIVSIGITADSFIVYFERVRDEVREGRPLRTAVEAGWERARRTILISDTVNFLAAVILYILAVGDVRGFAFTLGLTTLVDVFIVFMFTKPAVTYLSRTAFFDGGHPLSGFSAEQLGRSPAYAGRGRIRTPAGPPGLSIAERRAAQQTAETDENASSDSLASSRRNS